MHKDIFHLPNKDSEVNSTINEKELFHRQGFIASLHVFFPLFFCCMMFFGIFLLATEIFQGSIVKLTCYLFLLSFYNIINYNEFDKRRVSNTKLGEIL